MAEQWHKLMVPTLHSKAALHLEQILFSCAHIIFLFHELKRITRINKISVIRKISVMN